MNRAEFMRRLTELLSDVPPAERDEAIQYYNDYFDDAGAENESGVIASLGTPEELAGAIKAGLNDGGAGGEFTETGFSGYAQTHKDEIMKTGADSRQNNDPYSQRAAGAGGSYGGNAQAAQGGDARPQKKGMSGGTIALIVIVAILTFPIWVGIAGALFGVAVALFVTVFTIFLAFLAVGLLFIAVSVALFVTGCILFVHAPLAGMSAVGVALVLFGLGLLAVWLMAWGIVKAVPALFRGCAALIRKIFHRGGVMA